MEKIEDEAKRVKGEIEKRGYRLGPSGRGRSWYMKDVEWQTQKDLLLPFAPYQGEFRHDGLKS